VRQARFDPAGNNIVAELEDPAGGTARLVHPWTTRGERGAEALLRTLRSDVTPLFVAGHVRASAGTLLIRPTALVLAGEGGSRRVLMPWLDAGTAPPSASPGAPRFEAAGLHLTRYAAASELAAELILNGLRRVGTRDWPGWERGIAETEERGYHRMAACLRQVRGHDDPAAALGLLKMLALARDLA
jgi:hypothetical protein